MHYVGKINREIYKCVSKDIVTDDVIITDERIQHIIEGHPNDYEQYCLYMQQIVEHPEYIIEAKGSQGDGSLGSFLLTFSD